MIKYFAFLIIGVLLVGCSGEEVHPATVYVGDESTYCADTYYWGWGNNLSCYLEDGTKIVVHLENVERVVERHAH